jgi:hypothetical protein
MAFAALGVVACADAWPRDDTNVARCAAGIGVAPRKIPDDGGSERIVLPATDAPGRGSGFDLAGSGERFVGPIRIQGGVGTVDLGCEEVSVAVYGYYDSPDQIALALGVAKDRWYKLELYCAGGGLDWINYDSTDGTRQTFERASGSCNFNYDPSRVGDINLRLPAVDMAVPRPIGGYTLDGSAIHLPSGDRGSIVLDGQLEEMIAFDAVDCTSATDCTSPPFYELATLIRDPTSETATLGILEFDRPGNPVNLVTRVQMPGLTADFTNVSFDAAFTTP